MTGYEELATEFLKAVNNITALIPNFSERQKLMLKSKIEELDVATKDFHSYAVGYNESSFPDILLGLGSAVKAKEIEYQKLIILFSKELQK